MPGVTAAFISPITVSATWAARRSMATSSGSLITRMPSTRFCVGTRSAAGLFSRRSASWPTVSVSSSKASRCLLPASSRSRVAHSWGGADDPSMSIPEVCSAPWVAYLKSTSSRNPPGRASRNPALPVKPVRYLMLVIRVSSRQSTLFSASHEVIRPCLAE